MKGVLSIFLGLAAFVQSQVVVPGAGVACGSIPNGAAVPDMHSCSRYMVCKNGLLYDFNCPEGFAYNPASSMCTLDASCQGQQRDINPGIPNPSSSPISNQICANYPSGTYLFSYSSCRDFYYCYQGNGILSSCPRGYAFNSFKSACTPSLLTCANL